MTRVRRMCLRGGAILMVALANGRLIAQERRPRSSGLAGRWTITFAADTLSGRGSPVTGVMTFPDTGVPGTLEAALDRLLDQPVPCYDPGGHQVRARVTTDRLTIEFTGTTADCDLSGEALRNDDGFTGTWTFYGYEGVLRSGSFRMARATPDGGRLPAGGAASSR